MRKKPVSAPAPKAKPLPELPKVVRFTYRNPVLGVTCDLEIDATEENRKRHAGPFTLDLLNGATITSEWR